MDYVDFSSDSSSSSSSSDSSSSEDSSSENEDVDMKTVEPSLKSQQDSANKELTKPKLPEILNPDEANLLLDLPDQYENSIGTNSQANSNEPTKHPKQLLSGDELNPEVKDNKAKFVQHYLALMTENFGDDLIKIRESNDFNDGNMPLLISALKEGVNMFDKEQRDLILSTSKSS